MRTCLEDQGYSRGETDPGSDSDSDPDPDSDPDATD